MEDRKRIILTEDDPAIQDAVRMMLEHKGYEVIVFNNGDPLLSGAYSMPDLFILDKQLPGVDGLDVCRYLKGQEATKHIPVLMLSASPQIGLYAKSAFADDYLEKPFKMQALRDIVSRLLV